MTFSNAFSWKKTDVFWSKCHWRLMPTVQLQIIQHWFGQWLGAEQATSHYLNQRWPSPPTPFGVTSTWTYRLCVTMVTLLATGEVHSHLRTYFSLKRFCGWYIFVRPMECQSILIGGIVSISGLIVINFWHCPIPNVDRSNCGQKGPTATPPGAFGGNNSKSTHIISPLKSSDVLPIIIE